MEGEPTHQWYQGAVTPVARSTIETEKLTTSALAATRLTGYLEQILRWAGHSFRLLQVTSAASAVDLVAFRRLAGCTSLR